MLFNHSERKGIIIIFILIISTIVLPRKIRSENNDYFVLTAPIEVEIGQMPQQQIKKVDLNHADSLQLVKIRGIGPYYASRILRYRKRLGGFYDVRQLKDLKMKYFDIDSNAYLFTADPNAINKADMDTMSFKAILHHPYLEYQDVQMIFNAKRKYGHISYEVLEKNSILPVYLLKKIKPYFK